MSAVNTLQTYSVGSTSTVFVSIEQFLPLIGPMNGIPLAPLFSLSPPVYRVWKDERTGSCVSFRKPASLSLLSLPRALSMARSALKYT